MAEAQSKVHSEMLVSTDWLAHHLQQDHLVILCVAADKDFYDKGHIPGARYVPWSRLVTQGETLNAVPSVAQLESLFSDLGVTRDSQVVIYGEKQGLYAARAYFTLDYANLAQHAALLDGGLERWRAEKREESTHPVFFKASQVKITPNPKVLTTLEDVEKMIQQKNATLVDARPNAEFTGEKFSEDVPRAGHIPGAQGIYWVDLVRSKEDPVLKPPAELRQIFESHGASAQAPVVSYCRTGVQASFDYFVAKYLGYDSRNYVSSFYEWSRKETPVESSH